MVRQSESVGGATAVLKGKDSDKEGVKVGRELDEFKGQGDTAKELIFILYQVIIMKQGSVQHRK